MARLFLIGSMLVSVFLSLERSRCLAGSLIAEHIRKDAEGEVSDVNCSGVEMMLRISASNGKFKLHARDYTRVEISEDASPFQSGEFKPCAELNGKTAKITFVTVDRKAYDGEIQAIEVEK
jgi:hypothetical protein